MKERPILFSGAMVRAILAGRKTQTRRVVKNFVLEGETTADGRTTGGYEPDRCQYGAAGDRLWVKESIRRDVEPHGPERWATSVFMADGEYTKADCWPWKNRALPSIHMPRGLCRIVLDVTGVRVERLQDISPYDAVAEGISEPRCGCEVCRMNSGMCTADAGAHVEEFMGLWDSINGKRPGCSWGSNPWVWVVSFKRVTDAVKAE